MAKGHSYNEDRNRNKGHNYKVRNCNKSRNYIMKGERHA